MKNIKLSYWALIVVLTGLWAVADGIVSSSHAFFPLRDSMINYTGIIAIGVMSVGMMLALRPVRIEPFFGGLDKTYRLHKWLGITALVFSVSHWLWAKAAKWMVGWGWLERPARGGPSTDQTVAVFKFFQSHRGLAETFGEWAFNAAAVLIVLALLKQFPYRYFFKTHRLLAIVYLFLVFHSIVLMKFTYWGNVIGPLTAVLMLGGSVAAFISLFRRVGVTRRAVATIEELERHGENRVLRVSIRLKDRWSGHQAGQFAFVTFDRDEGPHPFTISSAWNGDGTIFFLIKGLGDYTNALPETLKVGDLANLEGPYGCFDFSCSKPSQIWVAGGIGITPFIARMQSLEKRTDGKTIDLFYSTSAPDAGFIGKVQQGAERAHVRLHVIRAATDGRLDAERICAALPDWKAADMWFCGPAGFGRSLRHEITAKGLSPDDFHQELFSMR